MSSLLNIRMADNYFTKNRRILVEFARKPGEDKIFLCNMVFIIFIYHMMC